MSLLKEMFKKNSYFPLPLTKKAEAEGGMDGGRDQKIENGPQVPQGMFIKCGHCQSLVYKEDVISGQYSCPKCEGYFRIPARKRLKMILDGPWFEEWDGGLTADNPLDFPGYEEKLEKIREKTHLQEAVMIGKGKIGGVETVIGVCDSRFLMGSMGYAVGEKIAAAFERATSQKLPVVLYCCSGGARMQEGIVSLMQMAKTSAAIKKHSDAGLFYLPILTDPTTGGVTASFAMLGDVILAEPKALIGFAGPRVIRQTIGQELPEGFQRAEFLLEHGLIDGIVDRSRQREVIGYLLNVHALGADYRRKKSFWIKADQPQHTTAKKTFEKDREHTAWDQVELARDQNRPVALDYVDALFTDFMELHGDRQGHDDAAVVGGTALFHGQAVTVVGIQKGRSVPENIKRNFGMPSPWGYEKALRLMKQAEKFRRPVICLVDTPGAFCGIEAEECGQGGAIARNLLELSALKTPVLSIVIGEGGSGGALALAVADEVWMLEHSIYSILSPEGFASILWKDSKRAHEAAEIMKITSGDLKELGMIDRIIPEGESLPGEIAEETISILSGTLEEYLLKQAKKGTSKIVEERYSRYREM